MADERKKTKREKLTDIVNQAFEKYENASKEELTEIAKRAYEEFEKANRRYQYALVKRGRLFKEGIEKFGEAKAVQFLHSIGICNEGIKDAITAYEKTDNGKRLLETEEVLDMFIRKMEREENG